MARTYLGYTQVAANADLDALARGGTGGIDVAQSPYSAVADDTTDNVAAFQAALAVLETAGSGDLIVPPGNYFFNITDDDHSLVVPSNVRIRAPFGATFRWTNLGSPLFAIVEAENVTIDGITFTWGGTLADVSGSNTDRFGWTGTLANRDFLAHILCLGSSAVHITNCRCYTVGDAPTVATEAFYTFAGFLPQSDDTTRTFGNIVSDCTIDDVVQGVFAVAQDGMIIRGLTSRRHPGNHPVGGGSGVEGHLVYQSENGGTTRSRGTLVEGVTDLGQTYGVTTNRVDTTVQLKACDNAIVRDVTSRRNGGIASFANFRGGVISGMAWMPDAPTTNGISVAPGDSVGIADSVMTGLTFMLPDNTDKAAWNMFNVARSRVDAMISAAHTTTSISSSVLTTCTDNHVRITYLARNTTSVQPCTLITTSLRNYIEIIPAGQNQSLRPFVNSGCLDNVFRMHDTVVGKWSNLTWWTTESDSPAMGFVPVMKTKVYRIGTTTNPTTTFQLPRAGVWMGSCQLMDSTGAHVLGGYYRIVYDAGSLQSVELQGTTWTVGGSAPSAINLAVSSAGVVTVTSTAGSAAWDIEYDFMCMGNNRYADF